MPTSLADQLLDAQVAYVLDQLTGDRLQEGIARDVEDILAIAGQLPIGSLLDPAEVKRVVRRLVASIPATVGATELVQAATDVVYAGPETPFALSELVSRGHVEQLVDEALGASHLVKESLDAVAESPLVAQVASRFVGRIVGDVLAANRTVAEKIPGVGSLMSLGTSAASKMMGAADKQFEQLLGNTAGAGATFAVRRLNKIILETMKDPTTRAAVLQVWDLYADQPVGSLSPYVDKDDLYRVVEIVQGLVATGAATEHAAGLADALVDAFFERYSEHPVTTLLDELEISRADLVGDIGALAPRIIEAARANGALEKLVRDRLEPFYRSDAVTRLLA